MACARTCLAGLDASGKRRRSRRVERAPARPLSPRRGGLRLWCPELVNAPPTVKTTETGMQGRTFCAPSGTLCVLTAPLRDRSSSGHDIMRRHDASPAAERPLA